MNEKNMITLFKESLKNKNTYIPNLLTASRLVGAFAVPGLFLTGNIPGAIIATAAFGATDFLDGKIARATNGYSEFGRILDPIVDKAFAIVPSLAILPSMPMLGVNIVSEAAIAYINSKSFVKRGNPKSSFLGKIKTFCLFPTIGLAYLSTAINIPAISLLANVACLGTLGVQTLAAKDYYKKAKQEELANITKNQPKIEESKEDDKEKNVENRMNYENTKEKIKTKTPTTVSEEQQPKNVILDTIDLDQIKLEEIPGLILAEPEAKKQQDVKILKKAKGDK